MLADQILTFLSRLDLPQKLPRGVVVMNPYGDAMVMGLCRQFYKKYYNDSKTRTLILGINPGRFGGGITGIPFTDPIKLENECGIKSTLQKKPELSADYIYRMITAYGGPKKFYQQFLISSVSPLGYTSEGKNLNYYDHRELRDKIIPFIIASLRSLLDLGLRRDICFCLGEGANYNFLHQINSQFQFFEKIVPLAHPRFIMQYKRKKVQHYIDDYLAKFRTS